MIDHPWKRLFSAVLLWVVMAPLASADSDWQSLPPHLQELLAPLHSHWAQLPEQRRERLWN